MFNKIKNLFKKKGAKEFVSHIKFRPGIGALAMETYNGVTIFYLEKLDKKITYHLFYNKEFYHGDGETIEEVEAMAHSDIDNQFKDYEKRNSQN